MTPVSMFLTVLYVGACFLLYGVITLISKFEDKYLTGEKR